ncbi:acetylglucosamine transferase [Vibrio vulnificus]|uniref:Acetylglucosamine transferase n=1 Tax=Vibrio vulnificus TaxID=672 RepID=A0AAN1PNJ0_VIBVL|nr:acetylglucosamine transferase [Vibrio vulnificus]
MTVFNVGGGTTDGQWIVTFRGIDDVIACDWRGDEDARRFSINLDIMARLRAGLPASSLTSALMV